MSYGFNDDKSKQSVPTITAFNTVKGKVPNIKVMQIDFGIVSANSFSYFPFTFPTGTTTIIPVMKKAGDWVGAAQVYIQDSPSDPLKKRIVVGNSTSHAIQVAVDVYYISLGV